MYTMTNAYIIIDAYITDSKFLALSAAVIVSADALVIFHDIIQKNNHGKLPIYYIKRANPIGRICLYIPFILLIMKIIFPITKGDPYTDRIYSLSALFPIVAILTGVIELLLVHIVKNKQSKNIR